MALASSFNFLSIPDVATYRLSYTSLYFQVDVPVCGCPTNRISDQCQQFISIHSTLQQRGTIYQKKDNVIESTAAISLVLALLLFCEQSNFLVPMLCLVIKLPIGNINAVIMFLSDRISRNTRMTFV